MTSALTVEVCVDSVEGAMAAARGGAARVELCDNLFEGGTTPSAGTIAITRQQISIDLNVIIRRAAVIFVIARSNSRSCAGTWKRPKRWAQTAS